MLDFLVMMGSGGWLTADPWLVGCMVSSNSGLMIGSEIVSSTSRCSRPVLAEEDPRLSSPTPSLDCDGRDGGIREG